MGDEAIVAGEHENWDTKAMGHGDAPSFLEMGILHSAFFFYGT